MPFFHQRLDDWVHLLMGFCSRLNMLMHHICLSLYCADREPLATIFDTARRVTNEVALCHPTAAGLVFGTKIKVKLINSLKSV